MDSNRIQELLEKYWECETSLEEEQELRAYFSNGDIDEQFKDEAPLFQYYVNEKKDGGLDGLFDEQVLAELEKSQVSRPKKGNAVQLFFNLAKVAAVGLIIVTAGYFIREEMNKQEVQPYLTDTFEDPQKAFEETKKALQLISKNFNKGRKEVKKLSAFNEAQEKIKENNL